MKYITVNGLKYSVVDGTNLKDALITNGLLNKDLLLCNGKGICGKCSVSIMKDTDRDYINVRSCQTVIDSDMIVRLRESRIYHYFLNEQINSYSRLGLSVDIGTTTLSMAIINLDNGKEVGLIIRDNPQSIFGSDVISRIDAYTNGENLQAVIHSAIAEYIEGINIETMVISANTVMQHIFAGGSLDGMRQFPMTADRNLSEITSQWYRIAKDVKYFNNVGKIIILPYVGEYFGADAVLGVIEVMKLSDKPSIFVDLGTNSEIAITSNDKVYCTAAAAGCALLGNYNGSDVVDAISNMLKSELIDDTGRINGSKGNVTYKNITLTQADIRSYQLMKAAIRCGIQIMLEAAGVDSSEVANIYISGQFGKNTEISSLIGGGIIPNINSNIVILGNSSLNGAKEYLMNEITNDTIYEHMKKCKYYNMAEHPDFNDIFVDEINF